ncbi:response regulator, partial [Sulfurimonas sp. SAG-AH-194-C21]
MLNQYQNEIIAAIAILTALSMYIIIKLRTDKNPHPDNETSQQQEQEEVIPLSQEETIKENHNIEEETTEPDLTGSEEGDFGEEEAELQNGSQETTPNRHVITKRDVPSHGNIKKQNFSEFSGERIIVAEDNLINQKVLTGLLAGSGIEVLIANDGQEVLEILENDTDFLMILMDAHMPRLDGFEATR